jgi:hypothetical protein
MGNAYAPPKWKKQGIRVCRSLYDVDKRIFYCKKMTTMKMCKYD